MKKKISTIFLLIIIANHIFSQKGEQIYTFLRMPVSPQITALGGTNISLISNDNSNAFQNPALLARNPELALSLNYMKSVADVNLGSVFFSKSTSNRGVWGIGVSYVDYGLFKETTPENFTIGSFSAKDISFQAVYAYKLTDRISGGITAKAIYSNFFEYSSYGVGFDLGLNYFNEENNLSTAVAIKNIGGQIVKYSNTDEQMPWDLQLGFSKKFTHAPFRIHITGHYLTVWNMSLDRMTSNSISGDRIITYDKFLGTLLKHVIFGFDFLPSKSFYLSTSYNYKTANDFKVQDQNGMYGFAFGTGFNIKHYRIGVSLSQQHIGGSNLMFGVSTDFHK